MEKSRIYITTVAIIMLIASFPYASMAEEDNTDPAHNVVMVQGTTYEELGSVMDVMRHISQLSIDDNYEISIIGRGISSVYIGKRKITNNMELNRIPASAVKSIEVVMNPDASFAKDVLAVVIINLTETEEEGFKVNEDFTMNMKRVPSFSNILNLKYDYKRVSFLSRFTLEEFRETRYESSFERDYLSTQQGNVLLRQVFTPKDINQHRQTITGMFALLYDLTAKQKLIFMYEARWKRFDKTKNHSTAYTYVADDEGILDKVTPGNIVPSYNQGDKNSGIHDINAEYTGKIRGWNISIGNNTVIEKNKDMSDTYDRQNALINNEDYIHDGVYTRSFATATSSFWKGKVNMGGEHIYNTMDILQKEHIDITKFRRHFGYDATTVAAFASIEQTLDKWYAGAGVRFEHSDFSYNNKPDDTSVGVYDFTYSFSDNLLYPSVRVGTQLGSSRLELSFESSYNLPKHENLHFAGSSNSDEQMLYVERISATTFLWNWNFLRVSTSYMHHSNPLFNTTDGKVDYNGHSFDALTAQISLSPTIGFWKPELYIGLYRQWLYMSLPNGSQALNDPFAQFKLNNTFTFRNNWTVLLNALWHSKGTQRNIRYQSTNYELFASVMKGFFSNRFLVQVSLQNALRGSWDDVTKYAYEPMYVSRGFKNLKVRNLSISMRYQF